MTESIVYAGIDTSKKQLDAYIGGRTRSFENTLKGVKRLVAILQKQPGEHHLIFEATGGYERLAVWDLQARGFLVSTVNAARVRQFAQSMGVLAKTDKIDARIITEYAQSAKPRPEDLPSDQLRQLAALVGRRRELDRIRVQESNRLDTTPDRAMRKEIQLHVAWLCRRLNKIDEQVDQLIEQDEEMHRKALKIRTITGLGRVSAFTLLCYMPELGTLSRGEIAALAGLAPYNRDSGTSHRRRHIYGGRAHVRACLYMAALAATQHDAYTARYYRHLVEDNHKPKKVALVAVMRKMLIAANSMLKNPEFQLAN